MEVSERANDEREGNDREQRDEIDTRAFAARGKLWKMDDTRPDPSYPRTNNFYVGTA